MKTKKKSASEGEEKVRYAIVREEKHEHLYAKTEGEQAYLQGDGKKLGAVQRACQRERGKNHGTVMRIADQQS